MGTSTTHLSPTELTARTLAADLDRRLAHVLEPAMRRRLVLEALGVADPETAYGLIACVERRPPAAGSLHDPLRDALHEILDPQGSDDGLDYAARRDIYAAARLHEDDDVGVLLRANPAHGSGEHPRLPHELKEIPLGRRRSLSHSDDRALLEVLARDLDPIVIRQLLRNPRIDEVDVIRMAASRPALTSTLEEIANSDRWGHRTRVRTALARNPQCPSSLAARLVPEVPIAELREMRSDPNLAREVRDMAQREIERRAP